MWADTSALDIQNWADSEPNNVGTELCVEMFHETGQWNDASCDPYGIEKGYICKAPKSTFHLFKYIYSYHYMLGKISSPIFLPQETST